MKQVSRLFMGTLLASLMCAGAMLSPALAKESGKSAKMDASINVMLDNDKVEVRETSWKPGQERAGLALGNRVVRAMKGGTLMRIYPDGKTENVTFKTGDVKYLQATPAYALKNIGKTEVVLYAVILK